MNLRIDILSIYIHSLTVLYKYLSQITDTMLEI